MKALYTTIFFLLIFISCDDFLNRSPLDAISDDNYWKSSTDLENYVLQYYPTFPTHGTWYAGMPLEDSNSDNLIISRQPNSVLNGIRGTTAGRWISDWSMIRSINIFFDNYQQCEDDFDLYRHYLGEAHFFRAWYYFELIKKYGDVPWYSTQLYPNSEEEFMRPRDSRTLVVDSIIADLDNAIQYLNYRSGVGNNRINKEAALAFKTRVALFEGTWQKYHANTPFGTDLSDPSKYFKACVDAYKELQSGQYQAGLYDDYYKLFGLDDMSDVNEVLLYRAYNINEGLNNDVQYATGTATAEMGVTWSLVSSYLDKKGKPYDYLKAASNKGNSFLTKIANDIDPRLNYTIWAPGDLIVAENGQKFTKPAIDKVDINLNPTGFEVKKCSNPYSFGAGKGGGGNSETGYILFRYGEVLLNYAEALYELEGKVAYDALNQLRTRVGMPEFSVMPQNSDPNLLNYGYPISDELYEIRRERRVELALEGRRADDYRRWAAHALFKGKRPKGYPFAQEEFPEFHPPLDENGLIDFFQSQLPNGYQFRENQDYLNSIPVGELTLNPNLEQNPGWGE